MRNPADNPVLDYLTIIVCSLIVAVICFKLGGSIAQVSGNENSFLGVTFSASGALAGFFIVFVLSQKALERFRTQAASRRDRATPVKIYVHAKPSFDPPATRYKCEASVLNEETGETRTVQLAPRFEAGFLTVHFPDVKSVDYLGAMITDDRNRQWVLQDFKPFTQTREAVPLLTH